MANAAPGTQPHSKHSAKELLESADFKALVARRWAVSAVLLVLLFVIYYGYIALLGVAKEWVSQTFGSSVITYAIPMGQAVIIFAFILTAYYVFWANRSYDPEVERLKGQLKH